MFMGIFFKRDEHWNWGICNIKETSLPNVDGPHSVIWGSKHNIQVDKFELFLSNCMSWSTDLLTPACLLFRPSDPGWALHHALRPSNYNTNVPNSLAGRRSVMGVLFFWRILILEDNIICRILPSWFLFATSVIKEAKLKICRDLERSVGISVEETPCKTYGVEL